MLVSAVAPLLLANFIFLLLGVWLGVCGVVLYSLLLAGMLNKHKVPVWLSVLAGFLKIQLFVFSCFLLWAASVVETLTFLLGALLLLPAGLVGVWLSPTVLEDCELAESELLLISLQGYLEGDLDALNNQEFENSLFS